MELPLVGSFADPYADGSRSCRGSGPSGTDQESTTSTHPHGWSVLRNLSELHVAITSTCNLQCSYCYAEVERPGKGYPLFPLPLFTRLMEVAAAYSQKTHIVISFHGGEPLLQSAAWYDEACALAKEILKRNGKSCRFILQSNLSLLREEHVSVFVRHGVRVGTSLDGPEEIHNAVRGRFQATAQNLRRLRDAGIFSGAIAVIHHHNWHLIPEVFGAYRKLGVRSFHFNIASTVGHGAGLLPLSEDQIYRVFRDDFDSMLRYDGETVETRLLDLLKRHVRPPTAQEFLAKLNCDNPFCHAGINMVVVNHAGEVYPCGCAGTSGNMKSFFLGNIEDAGCDSAFYRRQLRRFHAKPDKYELECQTCPARFVCEHGCPAYDINDRVTPDHQCAATKRFHNYLESVGRTAVERVASFNRTGQDASRPS